jgi:LPPG:FO 2-phospho-L-lactate transferase
MTPEVAGALADARAIVIGPSNPAISIGPILAVPGMRAALAAARAPIVAVSPFVRGQVVKGPTALFAPDLPAALEHYDGLLDGVVADERVGGLTVLETDVAMPDVAAMARLAEATLRFATGLA